MTAPKEDLETRRVLAARAGLCSTCRYLRVLGNRRGSLFVFCRRSEVDEAFSRYPGLPVERCPGFESWQEGSPGLSSSEG